MSWAPAHRLEVGMGVLADYLSRHSTPVLATLPWILFAIITARLAAV